MSNTQRLAEVGPDHSTVGYVFDLVVVYLMFGRVGRWILAFVNIFQKSTNCVSEVERRAMQLMEERIALMRILAKKPWYLKPGTYDDLMG